LHGLGKADLDEIETKLTHDSTEMPVALMLPSLFSELEGKTMEKIVRELKKEDTIDYL
jgi:glucosyl-3-phosphoglycerate synthase